MARNTIEFKGKFDGSEILKSLKQIRQAMADAGADTELFKNVDSDINKTEKLISKMTVQIQRGFSNVREVDNFKKYIDKLQESFLKVNADLRELNQTSNFNFNSEEIRRFTDELNNLLGQQDKLKADAKESVKTMAKKLGASKEELQALEKEIDANNDLEETLKRVMKAKAEATKQKNQKKALDSTKGQEFIANANANLSLEDLGATATKGRSARGKDDARSRTAGGTLRADAEGNYSLDIDRANVAILESYRKALAQVITTGGDATDAIEEMRKELHTYGIEIANTDQLQDNFSNDLTNFTQNVMSPQQRTAIANSQRMGTTDASGQYNLSDAAMNTVVNNPALLAYRQNLTDITNLTTQLDTATQQAFTQSQHAVSQNNVALERNEHNIENVTTALHEQTQQTREAGETMERLDNSFDNMKNYVKNILSISSAFAGLRSVITKTFEDIKELDKSFADIAMVTDYSVGEMWESYEDYSKMANELGQSTQSVIQASGLFYQQGRIKTHIIKKILELNI